MTRLTIAIPSKGRLKEKSEEFFGRAGFRLRQKGGDRGYAAHLEGLPDADVMLLSASEIARGLLSGKFHIGITGEDLLHEYAVDVDRQAGVITPLGFGHADVVVAVPQSWLDVSSMSDLEAAGALFRERHGRRMRVATKYTQLTRQHFARHSVGEYKIVESAGATEAAPASGTAELIVDITSTGATLRANGLKVLADGGVILKSEAALTGSLAAEWTEDAKRTLRHLLDSVDARSAGDGQILLSASCAFGAETLSDISSVSVLTETSLLCHPKDQAMCARRLVEAGVGPVSAHKPDFIFSESNGLFDGFVQKLVATS